MQKQPKVSVLIPAYNAESTIESALASIQKQSFDDYEVVVVNDGSTDGTESILDRISGQDARVRVINTQRSGIICALNTGIEECAGELIARMDADDISHRRRLEMQVELMDRQSEISVCSCFVRMFPRTNLPGGMARYEQWLNSLVDSEQIGRDMFVESPIPHPSAVMRRRELIDIGGYMESGWAEDYDLWLRYHAAGKRFIKVERDLLFWRHCDNRLTFTDGRYSVENFLRAKAHYVAQMLAHDANAGQRKILMWGVGQASRRLSKHLIRNGVPLAAFISINPNKRGQVLRGRPIVGPKYLSDHGAAETYIIVTVSSHHARNLIREQLSRLGFAETRDYICAA